jgi:Holliday junction resolvase
VRSPSEAQEYRIARNLSTIFGKGHRQPASGNQAHSPNDVAVANHLHVECKTTAARRILVDYNWIQIAKRKALQFGVAAVIAINFHKVTHHDYFIISDEDFYNLLRIQREHEGALQDINSLKQIIHSLRAGTKDAYEGQL